MDLDKLIAKKAELIKLTQELDEYTVDLLKKKRENIDTIDAITRDNINPLKLENSEIDAELTRIMRETGMKSITCDTYGVYAKAQTTINIIDPVKVLDFIKAHPEVMKKDVLKVAPLEELEEQGIVPVPEKDGFETSTAEIYQFRRK